MKSGTVNVNHLEHRRYVAIGIAGIIIYPAWGVFFNWLIPGVDDTLPSRILASTTILSFLLCILFVPNRHKLIHFLFQFTLWVHTFHYFWVYSKNPSVIEYKIGALVTIASISSFIERKKDFFIYSVVDLIANILFAKLNSSIDLFVLAGNINLLIFSYLNLHGRNKLVAQLFDSEKLIYEQKLRMNESSKLSTIGEMAAGVAHEINNPLAIIQGLSEEIMDMITEDSEKNRMIKKFAEKINLNTSRISKIVRSLKLLSRDASQDPFIPEMPIQVVQDSLDLCAERIKNKGIKFQLIDPHSKEVFSCRPSQLSQIMVNLLNNSIDEIQTQKDPWIEIAIKFDDSHCYISVTDSGNGIPIDIREKIMNPFFTTKDVGHGTGLGLSISTQIARDHGGDLCIDTKCSNTRFVLKLPLIKKEAAAPVATPSKVA